VRLVDEVFRAPKTTSSDDDEREKSLETEELFERTLLIVLSLLSTLEEDFERLVDDVVYPANDSLAVEEVLLA
jgi:hypothetical protein